VRISAYDRAGPESAIPAARAVLGDDAFAAAWRAGEGLSPGELFARAAEARALAPGADDARALGVLVAPPQEPGTAAAPCGPAAGVGAPAVAPAATSAVTPAVTPAAAAPAVRVLCFGPLLVARGGRALGADALTPAKARELLLYLALHPPRTKEQLALALWPDASEARVRSAFHVTLHHLRRILGGRDAVAFDGAAYALARAAGRDAGGDAGDARAGGEAGLTCACDVDEVLAAAAAARRADEVAARAGVRGPGGVDGVLDGAGGAEALAAWRRALAFVQRGPLGEGVGAGDWLVAAQARVAAAWADGMEALARLYARRDAPAEAAAVLEVLVGADPMREGAHRALMACYAAAGEPGRALAHYAALDERFARELGARPARETRALAEAIRRAGDA
jgi:DNA-binding SARP family transcriptional activator